MPEGITYDPVTASFFVGSTYKRKIIRIDEEGTIYAFTKPAQDSLWGVLGLAVDSQRRHLWVATSQAGMGMPIQDMEEANIGRAAVFKYHIDTGAFIKRYALTNRPTPHFLNDLVVTRNGTVFITDTETPAVYTITPERDSLDVFLDLAGTNFPNGITLSDDERYLFLSLWGNVGRITLADTTFTMLAQPESIAVHADGLYFYENSLIAVQPFDVGKIINQYALAPDQDAIISESVLQAEHPAFIQPTTGVIVDDTFYYIANSQIQLFQRSYTEHGEAYPLDVLQDVVILKTYLL